MISDYSEIDMRSKINEFPFDDVEIVNSSLEGDFEALNQLMLIYQDLAYSVAYRILGEQKAAEDIVQNSFLSAFNKSESFRGGSFKTWLLKIVVHGCYDELRRNKQRFSHSLLDAQNEEARDDSAWSEASGETPEEAELLNRLSLIIQGCLDELDPATKTAVVLVDVIELGYADAAAVAGVPIGVIKSRLSIGRSRILACLKSCDPILPDLNS